MFALVFRFPGKRYHATPWGRHVNEADVAWPPEPWRILRALIATWHRKGNEDRWSDADLADLVDALAAQEPIYRLPERAVHAHTRHYMPAPAKPTLVFDAFVRLADGEELTVAWPDVRLEESLFALAADLSSAIGYLGRAESWVECEARSAWDDSRANCRIAGDEEPEGDPVRVIAPLSPSEYAMERTRLLEEIEVSERRRAETAGKRAPSAKALEQMVEKKVGRTLPERLVDALALDTADYQRYGWTRPPASRELVYTRPTLRPTARRTRSHRDDDRPDDRDRHTVARYLLAGRPRPRVEDTIRIGEVMRRAALARFKWTTDPSSGRRLPNADSVISGRDEGGRTLRDEEHVHAFWLPEDADDDGEIDHIVVCASAGFPRDVRRKLDSITKLWIAPERRRGEGDDATDDDGREEWRLALEDFGTPADFADASRLFGPSRVWISVTPFLASGHLHKGGRAADIQRLLSRRSIVPPDMLSQIAIEELATIPVHGRQRHPIHFHRFRSRGREAQPDKLGTFFKLTFPKPIVGPLALGYASHFGLGLFAAIEDEAG